MSSSTAFRLWGGRLGPLTVARIACTSTGIQIFDGSSAPRTAHDDVKSIVIMNPSSNTNTAYVGNSDINIGATAPLYMFEIAKGGNPLVIDLTKGSGISKWYLAGVAGSGPSVMVSQIG